MVIKMKAIETALSLTQAYKLGIERFEKMLGEEFSKAIELMSKTNEHIIICGMGKSGLVDGTLVTQLDGMVLSSHCFACLPILGPQIQQDPRARIPFILNKHPSGFGEVFFNFEAL